MRGCRCESCLSVGSSKTRSGLTAETVRLKTITGNLVNMSKSSLRGAPRSRATATDRCCVRPAQAVLCVQRLHGRGPAAAPSAGLLGRSLERRYVAGGRINHPGAPRALRVLDTCKGLYCRSVATGGARFLSERCCIVSLFLTHADARLDTTVRRNTCHAHTVQRCAAARMGAGCGSARRAQWLGT